MPEMALQILANSLWVGLAAAAFAGLSCLILRDASARHWVCFLALTATAVIPVAQIYVPEPAPSPMETAYAPVLSTAVIAAVSPAPWDWNWLLWVWTAGAAALAAMLALRIRRAVGAKRRSVWVSTQMLARRSEWRAGLPPGRDGSFLESREARSPFAVGWFAPAVVFPQDIEQRLEDADLKRLWLHEAAHLRRFDDWSALTAEVLGTLLFFHPAAWWLRRRMAAEREFACDEAAARAAGSTAEYALTLTRFAELRLPHNFAGELGFAGGPSLSRRIKMLFNPRRRSGSQHPAWAFGLAGLSLAAVLICGPKVSLAQQEPPAPPVAPNIVIEPPNPNSLPVPTPATEPHPAPEVDVRVMPPAPPTPLALPVPPVPPLPPADKFLASAQAQPDAEKIRKMQEAARKMAEDARRRMPDPERMREIQERAREMAEHARQSIDVGKLQEQAERMRLEAARIRESVPTEEIQRAMEAAAKEMVIHAEAMQERMERLGEEMRRVQEEMQPQLERLEKEMAEQERLLEQELRKTEPEERKPAVEPQAAEPQIY